jgi:hypothetical protein
LIRFATSDVPSSFVVNGFSSPSIISDPIPTSTPQYGHFSSSGSIVQIPTFGPHQSTVQNANAIMEMDPNLLVDVKAQAEFEQTYRHELLPGTEDETTDYFYGDPKVDVESIILARYPRMRSSPARLRSMVEKTIKSWEKEDRRNSSNPSLDEDESMSDVFQGSCMSIRLLFT